MIGWPSSGSARSRACSASCRSSRPRRRSCTSRRCTHQPPVRRHSEQPSVLEGVTFRSIVSRWVQSPLSPPDRRCAARSRAGRRDCSAPRSAAGRVGRQPGSTARNDSGSAFRRPTSTSPTMRPPTGPSRSPCADHVGLAEDVEPERRLVAPAVAREPDVGRVERLGADEARDRLARGQADRLAALEVARGERVVGLVVDVAGDLRRQVDQARGQAAVHPLRPLRGRLAGQVEQQRPVDGALGRDRRRSPSGRGTSRAPLIVALIR